MHLEHELKLKLNNIIWYLLIIIFQINIYIFYAI